VFKDKPPTPFKVPPGLRMIRWSYEGGTIDEVFKPGTEPGGELAAGTSIDSMSSMGGGGVDGTTGRSMGGGAGRPTLTGTGETY
jgi:penicillin-binding protein 1A